MPFSTSELRRPYLCTTGHRSGGASSTLGQPRRTAVSQMRSMFHCQSVALRHQYASDCLMRPFVTTRLLLEPRNRSLTVAALIGALSLSNAAELGHSFFHGFKFLDERNHAVLGIVEFFGLLEHV